MTGELVSLDDYEIKLVESGAMFSCEEDHPPIAMIAHEACQQCGGADEYGSAFCPVCQFCCGC